MHTPNDMFYDIMSKSEDFYLSQSIDRAVGEYMKKQRQQLSPQSDESQWVLQLDELDPLIRNKVLNTEDHKQLFYEAIYNWNSCYLENLNLKYKLCTLGGLKLLDNEPISFCQQSLDLTNLLEQSMLTPSIKQQIHLKQVTTQTTEEQPFIEEYHNICPDDSELVIESFKSKQYTQLQNQCFKVNAQLHQFVQILLLYISNHGGTFIPNAFQQQLDTIESRLMNTNNEVDMNTIRILNTLIIDNN